jgi:hypothetical protein
MPVRRDDVGESPLCSIEGEPAGNVEVSIDVSAIVEINELVAQRLTKNNPRNRCERETDRDDF